MAKRMTFTVELFGQDAAVDLFRGIAERAQGREPLALLGDVLVEYEKAIFATRNRGRWRRDSAATIRLKHGSRTLVDTGQLMRQLTGAATLGRDDVAVATSLPYAKYVRDGRKPTPTASKVPGRNPAPRPPRQVLQQWQSLLAEFIADGRS